MKCKINIIIGGESITIVDGIDSSLTPSEINEDFMNIVKNSGKVELIRDKLKSTLFQGRGEQYSGEDKNDFGKIQIANATARDIMESAPPNIQAMFPNIDLSKIKVRLVDKFENYGTNIIVRQSANGEDIYLLDRTLLNFRRFADHLAVENAINNEVLNKLDKDSDEIKIIDSILEKASLQYKKVTDRKSLLKHYIKNKSKYNNINIFYKNGNYTAAALLDSILPKIKGIYTPKNNNYSTPLIRNLFAPGGMVYKNGLPTISYGNLFTILNGQYKMSMFKSQSEFNTLMKSNQKPDNIVEFFNQFNIDVTDNIDENYSILFEQIFKDERGFPYLYRITNKDGKILFKSNYYKLEDAYDMTYDTILLMDKTSYKGWTISNNEIGEYFISQYELQPNTGRRHVSSIDEAKRAIDKIISEQTFKTSFMLPLFNSINKINGTGKIQISRNFDTLQKGNVIKIPNIELPNNIEILDQRESIISGNYNIDDFKEVVKLWPEDVQSILIDNNGNLIKQINDVNKAGLFLSLLNVKYKNELRTPEMINDILDQIKNAGYKYFYVENVSKIPLIDKFGKVKKDKYGNIIYVSKQIKLVKLTENPEAVVDEYKQEKGFQYPVISFWEETAEVLNKKFGTQINIKTKSEIFDEFGEEYSKQKAFIKGNQVYINSTIGSTEDLLHEYIHIIMGYLKVNNPEVYSQLLKETWNQTNNSNKDKINFAYSKYDHVSKLEENFVKRFAEYIYNKGQKGFEQIFDSGAIEDVFETIFDKAEFNLKEAGKHELSEIFGRLSSEISMALQKDDKMFDGFASSRKFRLLNKKTNLLHEWLSDGKLKEYNCR